MTEEKDKGVFGFSGIWGLVANGTFATLVAILFTMQQQNTVTQLRELQLQMWQSAKEDREIMRSEMSRAHELASKRWQQVQELTESIRALTAATKATERAAERREEREKAKQ